jgi:hypothetical protein
MSEVRPSRASDHPESVEALHAKLDAQADSLAEFKESVREDMRELKDTTKEIKAAQLVTNGRVTQLELWQARAAGARAAFSWAPPLITGTLAGIAVVAFDRLM